MADLRRHTLTTAYLGSEQTIPASAEEIEVWGVDADPATATAAVWFRLTDPAGDQLEILIAAGQTYTAKMKRAGNLTYNVKATTGTPDALVRIV